MPTGVKTGGDKPATLGARMFMVCGLWHVTAVSRWWNAWLWDAAALLVHRKSGFECIRHYSVGKSPTRLNDKIKANPYAWNFGGKMPHVGFAKMALVRHQQGSAKCCMDLGQIIEIGGKMPWRGVCQSGTAWGVAY